MDAVLPTVLLGVVIVLMAATWTVVCLIAARRQPPAAAEHHAGVLSAAVGLTLLALVAVPMHSALAHSRTLDEAVLVLLGMPILAGFLVLIVCGFFGYGSASSGDWPALVPFAIALVVREVFTLHSVQEIEIQFAQGPVGRHSVVYPLLQLLFAPAVGDPHAFTMHLNGVLGAIAAPALFLFVRQRTESRGAAFLCALFFALHPLLARFAPTDGPYSFLLAAWFSGLALLSAPNLGERGMIGGAALVGMAASTRMEGSVFLIASLLMLDRRRLFTAARRMPLAALLSLLVIALQLAVQMYFLLPTYVGYGGGLSPQFATAGVVLEDAVRPPFDHSLFPWLVLLGAFGGLLFRRLRLGLYAFLATLVMLVPNVHAGDWIVALHRMIPACAVQTIAAGIGAYTLATWIPWGNRLRWLAIAPGALAAIYMFAERRDELTAPYVFTEEYELVRRHLGPLVAVPPSCTLLTMTGAVRTDLDLHDFRQVVPGMRVLDCATRDCRAELSAGGCLYYVRSAACYFHVRGLPPACAAADASGSPDPQACLNEPAASFETAVELDPVEVRTIDLRRTFPDAGFPQRGYPDRAEVGLFKVRPKGTSPQALGIHGHFASPRTVAGRMPLSPQPAIRGPTDDTT